MAHGCPVHFLLYKAHGIDSNGGQRFATQLDMKRITAVPHSNTVFRDILKLVPWTEFDRLVEKHGTDDLWRCFTAKRQLLALLHGQLSGASSLRDIEASMSSHQARLYHAGGAGPAALDLRGSQPRPQSQGFLGSFHAYAGHGDARLTPQVGRCGAPD